MMDVNVRYHNQFSYLLAFFLIKFDILLIRIYKLIFIFYWRWRIAIKSSMV
jgi:hypothetical protein